MMQLVRMLTRDITVNVAGNLRPLTYQRQKHGCASMSYLLRDN